MLPGWANGSIVNPTWMPSASADLRGTAYGFFNLMSGIALLIASGVAGLLWDQFGPVFTFYAGAGFCVITLVGLAWQPSR